MTKVRDTVIQLVVSFFGMLALTFFVAYLTGERGTIAVSSVLTVNAKPFVAVDVTNFKSDRIDGLRITAPSTMPIDKIASTPPVQIEKPADRTTGGHVTVFVISGLEGNRITRLMLPLENPSDEQYVQPLNPKEKGLSTSRADGAPDPYARLALGALVQAIIFAFANGALAWWSGGKLEDLERRLAEKRAELEKKISDSDKQRDELGSEHKRLLDGTAQNTKAIRKLNILLLARISDYRKENDFWRDTVRKVMASTEYGSVAERLIEAVTEGLKTYSTRTARDGADFDTLAVLADMISEHRQPHRALPSETEVTKE
jgi:hypothetical protein